MKIFEERQTSERQLNEFKEMLEQKKNDFNKMKRDMMDIDQQEKTLKEQWDKAVNERNAAQERTTNIKANIKKVR